MRQVAIFRGKGLRGPWLFADHLGPEGDGFAGRIFTLRFEDTRAFNFQEITADLFPARIGNLPSPIQRRQAEWSAAFPDRDGVTFPRPLL